jgi:predicted nucleotidyltransferase
VLFGSYALGNYTVASDIDLLVVYQGEQKEDAFATVKKTMDIPRLEPHVYSEAEYKLVKNSIGRMTARGVVLFSKEDNLEES